MEHEGEPESYELRRPFHLRIPVVILAVFATVGLAAWLVSWGSAEPAEEVAGIIDGAEVEVQPQTAEVAEATRDSCPEPGIEVDPGAAEAVQAFMATAAGAPAEDDSVEVRVSPEVAEMLTPEGGGSPVDRMTRIRGWTMNGEQVVTCAYSYWWDGSKQQKSLDLIVLDPVGAGGSPDTRGADGYTVTGWWRGEQEPLGLTTISTLHFIADGSTCGDPDRLASIGVEASNPQEELTATLEELVSGAATRSVGAQSMVPPDVQVLSVDVQSGGATVSLTGSDTDMLRCEGRAGFEQVEATVESYLESTLRTAAAVPGSAPGASTTSTEAEEAELDVTVLVDGQETSTLRR